MLFSKRTKSNAVILYKICDSEYQTIDYVNVVNGDFSDLWDVFRKAIGKPSNIKAKGNGFSCTVNKEKYFIDPF